MTPQAAAEQVREVIDSSLPVKNYQFRQDPEALGRTPGEQLVELLKQADFVEEAVFDDSVEGHAIDDLIVQLHHDMESFWRALARRNGQGYVDAIFQRHEDLMQSDAE